MTQKERNEIRVREFNMISFQLQLGMLPFLKTNGDVLDHFGFVMREKTGEYTHEDEQHAIRMIELIEKHNTAR